MSSQNSRSSLLTQLREKAVLHGSFTLASGRASSHYVDARRVSLSGEGSRLIGTILFEMIVDGLPDAVGGLSMGADPLVTATTVISAIQRREVAGLLVRKTTKEHGTQKQIEGPLELGMRVVVLEDTATTGSSALAAIDALKSAGATVDRVIALIDREEGAAAMIRSHGIHFDALFSLSELLG